MSVVPANEASCAELEVVFGSRGPAAYCRCQRYKLAPRESFGAVPVEERAERLREEQTDCRARVRYRKRGVGRALVQAAVDFARERGARALEGYPIVTKQVISEELHVGTVGMFSRAGFTEVSRPTPRRMVMRIDFDEH